MSLASAPLWPSKTAAIPTKTSFVPLFPAHSDWLQRNKTFKKHLALNRYAYRERECEDREHKEDGPLGICGGLEGQPRGNEHLQCGNEKEKANSNEDIWGIETRRELLLVCKPSNTWKIPLRNSPRRRRRWWWTLDLIWHCPSSSPVHDSGSLNDWITSYCPQNGTNNSFLSTVRIISIATQIIIGTLTHILMDLRENTDE